MTSWRLQGDTRPIVVKAVLSSDGKTAATGKTIAIQISKNGGAFGNPSAGATNMTEISDGWYSYTPSSADTGTLGTLVVIGSASGVDPVDFTTEIKAATNLGLSALPTANPSVTGGLLTAANNSNYAKGVVDTVIASINGWASLGAGAAIANPKFLYWTGTLSPNPTGQLMAQDTDTVVYNSKEIYYNGNSWHVWWYSASSVWAFTSVVGTLGSAYWTSPTLGGTWTPNGTATGSPVFVVLGGAENPASETNATTNKNSILTAIGDVQNSTDTISAAIDALGSSITVVSPLSSDGTRLELVQGDSYSTVNGRSLTFTITGQTGLVGSVAHLRIADTAADLATSATIASGTQTVTFSDITTTQTQALVEGSHRYQIRFVEGSDKATPIEGVCIVRKGL